MPGWYHAWPVAHHRRVTHSTCVITPALLSTSSGQSTSLRCGVAGTPAKECGESINARCVAGGVASTIEASRARLPGELHQCEAQRPLSEFVGYLQDLAGGASEVPSVH